MDGIALTSWLLVQFAFDSRPSMNEGLRQSQDDIGFRQFCKPMPNENSIRSRDDLFVVAGSGVKWGTELAQVVKSDKVFASSTAH